jgi:ATP-dependent 26S proteasome regulatory subunit
LLPRCIAARSSPSRRPKLLKLGLPIKKGLLFYGPPGTGKTHTMHYLASQLPNHTTLLATSEQVALLDHYFQLARFLQPAMIVIEDVDLIARRREEMYGPCDESLLNKWLNEMDGLREDAAMLFVLTTNRPEHLEVALASRPGRIDQAIEFPLPDDRGRRQLIRLYACGLSLSDEIVDALVKKQRIPALPSLKNSCGVRLGSPFRVAELARSSIEVWMRPLTRCSSRAGR